MDPTPLRFITAGDVVTDFLALVFDDSDRESLLYLAMHPVTEEARQ